MKQFQRLGVFLNQEPGDDEALLFTGRFAEMANAESVYCVLVHGMEDQSQRELPSEDQLRHQVLQKLPAPVAKRTNVEVHSEKGIREILRCALDHSLDLIIVGRRLPHDQRAAGSAFARLVRKSPCSVMVVPDNGVTHLGRVQVLVDGSEHSRMALATAVAIAQASGEPNPQVVAHLIYEVNYGYRYTGQSFQEAVDHLEEIWREKMSRILESINTQGVEIDVVYSCSHDLASASFDLASARNMDMIVLGSRGQSMLAAALVGDNTENVVAGSPLPVFVVKKKGETVGILEALLSG